MLAGSGSASYMPVGNMRFCPVLHGQCIHSYCLYLDLETQYLNIEIYSNFIFSFLIVKFCCIDVKFMDHEVFLIVQKVLS